jgi:hypothetical protein
MHQNTTNDNTKNSKPKASVFKTIVAIVIIMAIGYGTGFAVGRLLAKIENSNAETETTQTATQPTTDQNTDPTEEEFPLFPQEPGGECYDKQIIYLYPKTEMKITVELGNPHLTTCSYPQYDSPWKVLASPNGHLKDLKTGRNLYALYYESQAATKCAMTDCGFVIPRENTVDFLEEKLEILGLNEYEAEEFIVYWLPRLQQNEYNYIRFATQEEIANNMPLYVNPAPDTTIRVCMYFKGMDAPTTVSEQILNKVTRHGYTVVEWGGCEIS